MSGSVKAGVLRVLLGQQDHEKAPPSSFLIYTCQHLRKARGHPSVSLPVTLHRLCQGSSVWVQDRADRHISLDRPIVLTPIPPYARLQA